MSESDAPAADAASVAGPDSPREGPRAPSLRRRLELAVAAIGLACHRRPRRVLVCALAIVLGLAGQLPRLEFLADVDRYLDVDDPIRQSYDLLREQFGRDDFLLVAITPPRVFDPDFLTVLRELHEQIEDDFPYVDEVQSLINARETRGEGDTLIVGELFDEWPDSPQAVSRLQQLARDNPFYRDLFLSTDGRTVGIVIRPLTFAPVDLDVLAGFSDATTDGEPDDEIEYLSEAQVGELVAAAQALVRTFRSTHPAVEIEVAGSPVLNREIQQLTLRELTRFSGYAFMAIGALLLLVFRRWAAVLLPITLVSASVVATLGLMGAAGRPLTFVSQIVPSFILAVGVGFSVHLLAIFFQNLDRGQARENALRGALHHSGPAILMSSLTTAGGMLSFVPADLVPIRDIGLFIPFGVLGAALLSLTALPAVLALIQIRARTSTADTADPVTERLLEHCGRIGTRYPKSVIACALVVLSVAGAGIPKITSDYDPLERLPEENEARIAIESIDRTMGGASGMELILDSGHENGLHDPQLLERIERLQTYAEATDTEGVRITKTISVVDIVKEIHQALNQGASDAYSVASDRKLIAQELLLFENAGSDDLEEVVDSRFQLARVTLKAPQVGAGSQIRFLEENVEPLRAIVPEAKVEVTGFFA